MPHVANLKMSMILRVPAVAHKSWLFSSSVCYELIFSLGLRHGVIRSISSTEGQQSTSSSGFRNIEVMDVNRVRVIGLNRPRQRNAVNRQTAKELYSAFRLFDEDDSSDVAVLYGKGGTFCAGYDLKELASASTKNGGGMDINEFLQDCAAETDVGPMGPSRLMLNKPVIAAVSGFAVAGGLELALLCDMRVAEEDATFGVFCRRFGVPLIDGGTVRLPALIGLSRALDMILTGRPVLAQEALAMGLVNRVVPRGNALNEALVLANQIAAFPQACMRADRNSAYHSMYKTKDSSDKNWLKEGLSFEYSNGVSVIEKESVYGAQKFASGVGRKGKFD